MPGEELERCPVELVGVFVQACVGEVLEDHQLGTLDAFGEGWGEAGRGDEVPAAVGDLGGGDDAPQLGLGVMGEDRFGLVQEGVDGLGWAAADEVLQGGDELRLLRVHLRGEAPREDALDHRLGHASKGLSHDLPALYDDREEGVRLRPGTVERQGGDPLWVLGRQPHPHRGAKRHAGHVRPVDVEDFHEPGHVVGQLLRRIRARRLVGRARPSEVDRHAGEVLGVLGRLECVAGVVGGQVGNEDERVPGSFGLVVHRKVPDGDGRHGYPFCARRADPSSALLYGRADARRPLGSMPNSRAS